MALTKEEFKQIDAEANAFEAESIQAASNLGMVLSDAAIAGRKQGFFAGMKKEKERSQKLVAFLKKMHDAPQTWLNEIQWQELRKVLTEYNTPSK